MYLQKTNMDGGSKFKKSIINAIIDESAKRSRDNSTWFYIWITVDIGRKSVFSPVFRYNDGWELMGYENEATVYIENLTDLIYELWQKSIEICICDNANELGGCSVIMLNTTESPTMLPSLIDLRNNYDKEIEPIIYDEMQWCDEQNDLKNIKHWIDKYLTIAKYAIPITESNRKKNRS